MSRTVAGKLTVSTRRCKRTRGDKLIRAPHISISAQFPETGHGFDELVVDTPVHSDSINLPAKPDKVGRFVVLEVVGLGGMGVVYKAIDPESGELVAVKTLRPDRKASESAIKRFKKETEWLAILDHPNIPKLRDTGEDNGVPFYAMSFISGTGLNKHVGRTADLEWRIGVVYKIAHALAHVHEKGLIHLDVKPSNILIDEDGEPYLVDFGIARCLAHGPHPEEEEDETGGTPLYMSPEQVLSPASVDGRADIYALGIVMYELLTGVRPFRGNGMEDIISRILFMDAIPPRRLNPSIPEMVEAVIMRAMDKCVQKRYPTSLELAHDLKRLMVRIAMQRRLHRHETAVDLPAIKRN